MKNPFKHGLMLLSYIISSLLRLKQYPAILMYHSFDSVEWKYGVSPLDLEQQIKFLLRNHSVVSLEEILAYARGEIELDPNSIAITIDDGYKDTYDIFFTLAKIYNIPFTLFLTTDLLVKSNLGNLPRPTESMICAMFSSGLMEIGLHGHTHMHFDTAIKDHLWNDEVEKSSQYLKKLLGVAPKIVAYPSGRYDEKVLSYFRSNPQYIGGVSIASGFVNPGDDIFLLRRIEVSRNIPSFWMFKMRLTAALDIYNKIITLIKK